MAGGGWNGGTLLCIRPPAKIAPRQKDSTDRKGGGHGACACGVSFSPPQTRVYELAPGCGKEGRLSSRIATVNSLPRADALTIQPRVRPLLGAACSQCPRKRSEPSCSTAVSWLGVPAVSVALHLLLLVGMEGLLASLLTQLVPSSPDPCQCFQLRSDRSRHVVHRGPTSGNVHIRGLPDALAV